MLIHVQSWKDYITRQKKKERAAKEAGIEHDSVISAEQATLAAPQAVSRLSHASSYYICTTRFGFILSLLPTTQIPEEKAKILTLHSSITELLMNIKDEVVEIGSLQSADKSQFSQKVTPLLVKLSRLYHRMVSMGEFLTTDKKATNRKTVARRGGALLGPLPLPPAVTDKQTATEEGGDGKPVDEAAALISRLALEAQASPWKSYIRLLLDVPMSSDEAYAVNVAIIGCFILSIVLLFWQTQVSRRLYILKLSSVASCFKKKK